MYSRSGRSPHRTDHSHRFQGSPSRSSQTPAAAIRRGNGGSSAVGGVDPNETPGRLRGELLDNQELSIWASRAGRPRTTSGPSSGPMDGRVSPAALIGTGRMGDLDLKPRDGAGRAGREREVERNVLGGVVLSSGDDEKVRFRGSSALASDETKNVEIPRETKQAAENLAARFSPGTSGNSQTPRTTRQQEDGQGRSRRSSSSSGRSRSGRRGGRRRISWPSTRSPARAFQAPCGFTCHGLERSASRADHRSSWPRPPGRPAPLRRCRRQRRSPVGPFGLLRERNGTIEAGAAVGMGRGEDERDRAPLGLPQGLREGSW